MQRFKFIPQAIKFKEGNLPLEIQLFRTGTFFDERYGKIEIKTDDLKAMIKNFSDNVRGVDLALDFSHDAEGPAAAWITALSLKNDSEIWAAVDWTEVGRENIKGKNFRYISPDFTFNYTDNENLKEYGPVLFGAGLTNRPVIKNMAPAIELSEYKGDKKMNEEQEKMLKELMEKVLAMETKLTEPKLKEKTEEKKELADDKKLEEVEVLEVDGLMKKITEQAAKITELQAMLDAAKGEVAMSERTKEFNIMLTEGKVCEAQRAAFLKDDMKMFLEKAQSVKLSTIGSGRVSEAPSKSGAQEKVIELANALMKSDSIKLSAAISKVLLNDKDLRADYEKEVLI